MGRKKTLVVERRVSESEINKRIREEKNRARIIPRLIFIKLLYGGKSVIEASKDVGVVKRVGYQWLERWNESGFDGLVPRFAGGKPSKLSVDQKKELRTLLETKDLWYLGDVVDLIRTKFDVEYSERQVRRILKGFKMKHEKPYQVDYRRPDDAEEKLKKPGQINPNDTTIGFFDEAAPQTTANTVRMWSFKKPVIIKNTTKFRANTFGFYAFNGYGVVNMYPNSKQERVMDFPREIRYRNPFNHIVVILDNFTAHRTENMAITSEILDIDLIFLPPYSQQLNPIELIWKSIKKIISRTFVKNQEMMVETVETNFIELSKRKTFCRSWIEMFVN